ncbi:MAG: glycogen/starch synthase [Candidatus Sericytochromatia bacterium]
MEKLLIPCTEYFSLSNSGDLGKNIYNLVKELKEKVEIALVLPLYKNIKEKNLPIKEIYVTTINDLLVRFYSYKEDNLTIYFIYEDYFFRNRELIYDHDNNLRFTFFSICTLELIKILTIDYKIMINDWHLCLLPFLLKQQNINKHLILNIYSLEHQGIAEVELLKFARISYKYFYSGELEFYGKINFLKIGLDFADTIIIKSKDVFEEIALKNSSVSYLEGILLKNIHKVKYIAKSISKITGLDENSFSENYKIEAKLKLQNDLNFQNHTEIPMIVIPAIEMSKYEMILLNSIVQYILVMEIQIVILGYDLSDFEKNIKKYSFTSNCMVVSLEASEENINKVLSASDMILDISFNFNNKAMLKKALKHGVLPILFRESKELETENIHFKIFDFTKDNLINTLKYAVNKYYYLEKWLERIKKAIKLDFSFEKEANEYLETINAI